MLRQYIMSNTLKELVYRRPFVISIEGYIGCGKSSLLSHCEQDPHMEVMQEPVNMWTNLNGANLLANYYNKPKDWGMTLQSYITLTMLQQHLKPTEKPIKIMERSLSSARYCFISTMITDGSLEPSMRDVLEEWYNFISHKFPVETKLDLIVYLSASPETCARRINERERAGDVSVKLDYLEELQKSHLNWLTPLHQRYQETEEGTPVYVLDAEQPIDKMCMDFKSYIGMWKWDLDLFHASYEDELLK